jgi:hypothetical protein
MSHNPTGLHGLLQGYIYACLLYGCFAMLSVPGPYSTNGMMVSQLERKWKEQPWSHGLNEALSWYLCGETNRSPDS